MATLFAHAAVAAALGQAAPGRVRGDWRFWYLAVLCSILPDADVVGFRFGVRYEDDWGHRGMTHSLAFALALGAVAAARLRTEAIGWRRSVWPKQWALFALITASHGVLDALTNGGLGVAFLAPFRSDRYFFPWTPIEVSPIGADFFSARGAAVVLNELAWVFAPAAVLGWILRRARSEHRG